jgi:hypothetical protein
MVKLVGEPDAGNPDVRFDERLSCAGYLADSPSWHKHPFSKTPMISMTTSSHRNNTWQQNHHDLSNIEVGMVSVHCGLNRRRF